MRIGVIRGDMPGPIAIMDLEPVSQYNPAIEPRGQERRFGRPSLEGVTAALKANVPAGLEGTTDVSAGVTITAANGEIKVKIDPDAGFTTVVVPPSAYPSGAALAVAANSVLAMAGAGARLSDDGTKLVIFSLTKGTGSHLALDAGSFNGAVGLSADDFTIPDAAPIITATFPPPAGPLDVSEATLRAQVGDGPSAAQLSGLADSIAPRVIETDTGLKSFQVGMISGYLSPTYNPDPSRHPPLAEGPAIVVVQDDGKTPFTAPMTEVTTAVHDSPNTGDITITGTNLGNAEVQATVVKVLGPDGARSVKLHQQNIQATFTDGTQGEVSPTKVVIPASLLSGLGVVDSKVVVQYTSLASNWAAVT